MSFLSRARSSYVKKGKMGRKKAFKRLGLI